MAPTTTSLTVSDADGFCVEEKESRATATRSGRLKSASYMLRQPCPPG